MKTAEAIAHKPTHASKAAHATRRAVSKAPWDDCKVAFGLDNADPFDDNAFWNQALPSGWELNEIDGTVAGYMAIFRVKGIPTSADGATVKRWLRKVGAITG